MTQPQGSISGFFSGGGKAAKFPTVGSEVGGKIIAIHPPEPQRDLDTGLDKPGKTQVRIELQTDARDPDIEFDDGSRTLYVKGWLVGAIGDALRKVGAREPEVGGDLWVKRIEDGPVTRPGLKAPYRYTSTYAKPTSSTGQFFNGGQQQPAQQAPAAPQNAPIPTEPPPGIDPKAWASMPADAKQAIANSMAAPPPFWAAHRPTSKRSSPVPEDTHAPCQVTFATGLPLGRHAKFIHKGELWIALPASKHRNILAVTDRLLGVLSRIQTQMTHWLATKPDDADGSRCC
jgi:hypothetical protein